jgi:hypothetical protein
VDAWVDISGNPTWIMYKSISGTYSFTCDFEVRDTVNGRITGSQSYAFQIQNIV